MRDRKTRHLFASSSKHHLSIDHQLPFPFISLEESCDCNHWPDCLLLFPQTSPATHVLASDSKTMNVSDNRTLPKAKPKPANKLNQAVRQSSKTGKAQQQHRSKSSASKVKCTRCGSKILTDVTQHELPKQKGLVYECMTCGNNSLRSNVSADERKRRLKKVAADHLVRVECQFCHVVFHAHGDYLMHLRNDHSSDK